MFNFNSIRLLYKLISELLLFDFKLTVKINFVMRLFQLQ